MKSQAHAALLKIIKGKVVPDSAIRGYNFNDGSRLTYNPDDATNRLGWIVSKCIPGKCDCLAATGIKMGVPTAEHAKVLIRMQYPKKSK